MLALVLAVVYVLRLMALVLLTAAAPLALAAYALPQTAWAARWRRPHQSPAATRPTFRWTCGMLAGWPARLAAHALTAVPSNMYPNGFGPFA